MNQLEAIEKIVSNAATVDVYGVMLELEAPSLADAVALRARYGKETKDKALADDIDALLEVTCRMAIDTVKLCIPEIASDEKRVEKLISKSGGLEGPLVLACFDLCGLTPVAKQTDPEVDVSF